MSSECFFGKGDKTGGAMSTIVSSVLSTQAPPIFYFFHCQVNAALVYKALSLHYILLLIMSLVIEILDKNLESLHPRS